MENKTKIYIASFAIAIAVLGLLFVTPALEGGKATQTYIEYSDFSAALEEVKGSSGVQHIGYISAELLHPSWEEFPDNTNCGVGKPEYYEGRVVYREPTKYAFNFVTDRGLNWQRDVTSGFSGGTTGVSANSTIMRNWTVIELSLNGTTIVAADISCPNVVVVGNGLDIGQATTIVQTTLGNYTARRSFTVTGGTNAVNTVCLSNNTASDSADLMAAGTITNTTVQNGDTLNINYSVAFVRA